MWLRVRVPDVMDGVTPTCPISFLPLATCQVAITAAGNAYNQASISKWLATHDTDPVSGSLLWTKTCMTVANSECVDAEVARVRAGFFPWWALHAAATSEDFDAAAAQCLTQRPFESLREDWLALAVDALCKPQGRFFDSRGFGFVTNETWIDVMAALLTDCPAMHRSFRIRLLSCMSELSLLWVRKRPVFATCLATLLQSSSACGDAEYAAAAAYLMGNNDVPSAALRVFDLASDLNYRSFFGEGVFRGAWMATGEEALLVEALKAPCVQLKHAALDFFVLRPSALSADTTAVLVPLLWQTLCAWVPDANAAIALKAMMGLAECTLPSPRASLGFPGALEITTIICALLSARARCIRPCFEAGLRLLLGVSRGWALEMTPQLATTIVDTANLGLVLHSGSAAVAGCAFHLLCQIAELQFAPEVTRTWHVTAMHLNALWPVVVDTNTADLAAPMLMYMYAVSLPHWRPTKEQAYTGSKMALEALGKWSHMPAIAEPAFWLLDMAASDHLLFSTSMPARCIDAAVVMCRHVDARSIGNWLLSCTLMLECLKKCAMGTPEHLGFVLDIAFTVMDIVDELRVEADTDTETDTETDAGAEADAGTETTHTTEAEAKAESKAEAAKTLAKAVADVVAAGKRAEGDIRTTHGRCNFLGRQILRSCPDAAADALLALCGNGVCVFDAGDLQAIAAVQAHSSPCTSLALGMARAGMAMLDQGVLPTAAIFEGVGARITTFMPMDAPLPPRACVEVLEFLVQFARPGSGVAPDAMLPCILGLHKCICGLEDGTAPAVVSLVIQLYLVLVAYGMTCADPSPLVHALLVPECPSMDAVAIWAEDPCHPNRLRVLFGFVLGRPAELGLVPPAMVPVLATYAANVLEPDTPSAIVDTLRGFFVALASRNESCAAALEPYLRDLIPALGGPSAATDTLATWVTTAAASSPGTDPITSTTTDTPTSSVTDA